MQKSEKCLQADWPPQNLSIVAVGPNCPHEVYRTSVLVLLQRKEEKKKKAQGQSLFELAFTMKG